MSPADQQLLGGAVEVTPKIRGLLARIGAMRDAVALPTYSEASGVGAALCTNAGQFMHRVAAMKGARAYLDGLHEMWSQRLLSVEAAGTRVTAVLGADF
jgi:hypothetical protein